MKTTVYFLKNTDKIQFNVNIQHYPELTENQKAHLDALLGSDTKIMCLDGHPREKLATLVVVLIKSLASIPIPIKLITMTSSESRFFNHYLRGYVKSVSISNYSKKKYGNSDLLIIYGAELFDDDILLEILDESNWYAVILVGDYNHDKFSPYNYIIESTFDQ
jgi:hypothetical protein